jgi:hypothetical protein
MRRCSISAALSGAGLSNTPSARASFMRSTKIAMATVMKLRAMKVDQAPPTAPRAGRPKVPGTSTRLASRFTRLASHMMIVTGPGRDRPSSQKVRATETAYSGSDSEKTISGAVAPSASPSFKPRLCRNSGPSAARSTAVVTPIQLA